MAFNLGGIGSAFTDLGGAVGDFFSAEGAGKQAAGYQAGAEIATQNSGLALESAKIQRFQQTRQASLALGTERATVAGNGFQLGGSGEDILRSSAQQSSLANSLINLQGQINSEGYLEQANAMEGEAQAAKASQKGGVFGGILGIVGAVASLL